MLPRILPAFLPSTRDILLNGVARSPLFQADILKMRAGKMPMTFPFELVMQVLNTRPIPTGIRAFLATVGEGA